MSDENTIKLLDESPAEEFNDSLPHEQTCNSILNIINNNKNVSRKVILLSGVRGSGKTTIIQKLIKENEKDKVFITIDAWNAPEDVLKKEFLKYLFRNVLDQRGKIKKGKYVDHLKNPLEKLLKDIDTIEKNVKSNINFITILIYCFVFIGIPILTNIENSPFNNMNFNSQYYYILFFIILLISFMCKNYIAKILFPFLYGSSDNYSEYEEGKDLTPYQFKQFAEKFYSLYSDFFDKDVIIVVDNMDRLSKDEEEKFISSLYTFIECIQKKDNSINIWFILAVDKKSIGNNNSSVDTSFYDKLSPYEVSIPEMNNDMVNNFFLKLLTNELEYYDDIKKVRGIDNIILLLNFSKNNILDSSQYITSYYYTPRLIKKFVNQIKINYYSYINLTEDKQILTKYAFFVASLFVSSVQIFNNEKKLLELVEEYKNNANGQTNNIKDKLGDIYNKILDKNKIDLDKLMDCINIIYYKMQIPNKDTFIKLIDNFSTFNDSENIKNILNYFSIFNNDKLKENLNEAIKEVLQTTNNKIHNITGYIIDIYNSLEKYNIIFLENNSITDMVLDKAIKINNNDINYNFTVYAFKFFVFSNNKNRYINRLRELLEYFIKNKSKDIDNIKIIFEYVRFIDKIYIQKLDYNDVFKLTNFDLFDNTLKDYNFLIDDGYIDLYLNDIISYEKSYFYINNLDLLMIIGLFIYSTNIKKILYELNKKGISSNNTISDENWNLFFICCYFTGRLDITEINNLIQIGINRPYYYISYLIALDSYLKGQNIDNDIFDKINNLNSDMNSKVDLYEQPKSVGKYSNMNAIIIILNKFKDNKDYEITIKEIIFYIFYNFHKNIETLYVIDYNQFIYILDTIIKEKYGENDEFYKALYDELKKYLNI